MRISDWSSDVCSSDRDYENGAALRLQDVAQTREDAKNIRQAAWIGQTPAILLNIQRQPGANVIDVVDQVKVLLPSLKQALPVGVDVSVATDRTQTIRDSIEQIGRAHV